MEITSVFPTTTASAITTFMTGQAPQQHGLTGWFTYMQELGAVTAVLPCQLRGSRESIVERGVDVASLYGHTPFFDLLEVPSTVLAPDWIIDSPFNLAHSGRASRVGYNDLDGMLAELRKLIRTPERGYIYAYWPEFDRLSHQFGNASEQVASHFEDLQGGLEQLMDDISASRTLVLISADHGFIDTDPQRVIDLRDHPQLTACLSLPLSGEPRVAYCYVRPRHEDSFLAYADDHFGTQLDESRELIARNAFGLGETHPQLAQRVGDYTLIMRDNYVIKDWLAGEKPFHQIGVHGGLSEQELYVPLIVLAGD
jgi:predicted AlkP superfamily pyrophosphatase or phosphodiesterase